MTELWDEEALARRIAQSIGDGDPVDWDAVRANVGPLSERLEELRVLETMAQFFVSESSAVRSTADIDDTEPEPTRSLAPADPLTPPFRWGHLRVLERIDCGFFGYIFRAHDPVLKVDVALKLLRRRGGETSRDEHRLIVEARRMARVRHEHLLSVRGADVHDGRAGIWTDLVCGKNLAQRAAEQGTCGVREAADVGLALCGALAAMHAAHIVHGDVKPANVMRENGGRILLMDFGAAVEKGDGNGECHQGTPVCMAPEILLERRAPTPASDVYSLGVLLYWLVTGRYPLEAQDLPELEDKLRRRHTVPILDLRPDLPPGFAAVIGTALATDPRQRYQSVGALAEALEKSLPPRPVPAPRHWWTWWAERPRARVAALATAAALAVFAGFAPRIWAPLEVQAGLYRADESGAMPLRSGDAIQPGDRLYLELRGSRKFFVYVLSEDDIGETSVLFPAGTEPRNPLPGRARHRLPGVLEGVPQNWVVTNAGGRETILVVAARRRLDDLEAEIAKLRSVVSEGELQTRPTDPAPGPIAGLGPERGIYEMGPSNSDVDAAKRVVSRLASQLSGEEDVWLEQFHLTYGTP